MKRFSFVIVCMLLAGNLPRWAAAADEPMKVPPKAEEVWNEVKTFSATLGRPTGKSEADSKPKTVQFSSKAKAFRMTWKMEPTANRGGNMKLWINKEGSFTDGYLTIALSLGVKAGEKGQEIITLGPGNYTVNMVGFDIKYELVIEEPEKKEVPENAPKGVIAPMSYTVEGDSIILHNTTWGEKKHTIKLGVRSQIFNNNLTKLTTVVEITYEPTFPR